MDSKSRNDAREALDRAQDAVTKLSDLRAEVDRLQMICEALWLIVRDRMGATEEQLERLVEEIDLRDGALNGRTIPHVRHCARCGRVVQSRNATCLYCGSIQVGGGVF